MSKQPKSKDTFKIYYKKQGNSHLLKFVPSVTPSGYKPNEIEVTEQQWHALKFHFMTMINDATNETKLGYVV